MESSISVWTSLYLPMYELEVTKTGTHMSVARLANGNFLIIDASPMNDDIKNELNVLTDNGKKVTTFTSSL